jgi:hypothetical protein
MRHRPQMSSKTEKSDRIYRVPLIHELPRRDLLENTYTVGVNKVHTLDTNSVTIFEVTLNPDHQI